MSAETRALGSLCRASKEQPRLTPGLLAILGRKTGEPDGIRTRDLLLDREVC